MKSSKHNKYSWVFILMVLILLMSSCAGPKPTAPSQNPAEPVTLRMWVHSNPHYKKIAEQNAADYEKATGVKISLDFLPWEEYGSKAVAAFAGGNEPDIMEGVASWLYAQKISGKLDEVPADLSAKVASRYHAPSAAPLEFGGKFYGIPLNVNIDAGPLFVANTALFKEMGVPTQWDSWDAYVKDLQKLTKKENGVITRSGVTIAGGDLMIQFLMYFLQAGGTFYAPDNKSVTINNEFGKKSLQTMYDFLYTYEVDSTDISDFSGVATGVSAGTFYGPWYVRSLEDDFPDMEWGWAKPPLLPGGTKPYFPSANVWAWMVSENSKNKEAAWNYIRWLDENNRRVTWSEETGEIPAVPELWKDSKIADNPMFKEWLPNLQYQVPLLHIGPQDEYTKIIGDMVSSVIFKTATIDDALAKGEKDLNEMLARTLK